MSQITADDIRNRFTHHPPSTTEQTDKLEHMRKKCSDLANEIIRQTKPGREQSVAITKLEEVLFWTCASIARSP